ncbi:hypothetical protein BDB01DRAFT_808282 [Pilobolus umbonatus]|nr:hypothetical protein BDB01DRAFT_808282 [Pilobolus umbonatus]
MANENVLALLKKNIIINNNSLHLLLFLLSFLYSLLSSFFMPPVSDAVVIQLPTHHEFCLTPTCVATASSILNSLNMNIDPCSDFYKYTCDHWIKKTIIPEELAGLGVVEQETKQHKEQLRVILDGTYSDLLEATHSPSSFLVDNERGRKIDKKIFKTIQDYYVSCKDAGFYTNDGFYDLFQDINILTYEMSYQETTDTPFHITSDMITYLSYPKSTDSLMISMGGLFALEVVPSVENRTEMSILLTTPFEFEDVQQIPFLEHGREALIGVVFSIFSSNNDTDRERERLELLQQHQLHPMTDAEIYSMVDKAIAVQKKLYNLSLSPDPLYNIYDPFTMQTLYPFMDWIQMLDDNVPEDRNLSNLTIQIEHPSYFNELAVYFNIDDGSRVINKDSIQSYLLLNKLLRDAPKLDGVVRRHVPDTPFQTRSGICVDKVLNNFGLVIGRYYAMVASQGEKDRSKLEEMAQNIKAALGDRITSSDWLDATTRASAVKKLNMMEDAISYSTTSPDTRSPREMYDYLSGLAMDTDTFYKNEQAVDQWIVHQIWDTIGRRVERNEWVGVGVPQTVNAFNLLSKNSIFLSVGFAQKPNYDYEYPDYINYGGIGQTLGHEYSHGFDDYGSVYDEYGMERNWWSSEVKQKYIKKTQCYINQYSRVTIRDEKGRKYKIDGSLTLGENIADNEGLSATYDAFIKLKESGKGNNPILPGLQNFSPESLFFISAARSFCSKPMPGSIQDSIKDEHAPDSVRANMIFQNSKHFSKVFNCPVGSPMNPNKPKCKIW